MLEIKRWYKELGEYHPGCEEPCSYFIPFESREKTNCERCESAYFTDLCGEWSFGWYANVNALEIEKASFPVDTACPDKITVPGNWQLNYGKGYDVPNYINQDYPFPVDPPFLPDEIPCGLYRRSFTLDKKTDKKYFINFEGVASCFYLWINGTFLAYSQVSHATANVDITCAVKDGENEIAVLVIKHCTGSYLEDQDFFRLSGIFRSVYILERDKKHISDIEIKAVVDESLTGAQVNIFTKGGDCSFELCGENGESIYSGSTVNEKACFSVDNPALWSDETPVLYSLYIESESEYIKIPLGFKRFEIKDSAVLLNGKKIKCRGINRHDSRPDTGYWVSGERMLEELYQLKQAGVNCIRTSHYPNDPRFPGLCDRLGFMLVDEADIETHGLGYNFGDWFWDYWAFCSDDEQWRSAYIDRAKLLYERDKNHVSVIMWSLGNESGCGENHRAMAQFLRSRDSRNIIHYENAHLEYAARLGKDFSDISDVESRMYASLDYLKEYLADDTKKKPFFYCEYVDSMSTGNIPDHWEDFEDNDKYFGGCVWEYCDHAVNVGTAEKPKYRYGGDFGDWPNDNICCVDGLVYPDRRPRPGYFDMKKTYQPFRVSFEGDRVTVFNKKFFAYASDISLRWSVEHNGKEILGGDFGALDIAPKGEKEYRVNLPEYKSGLYTLNLFFVLNENKEWAQKGFEVGFEQFILSNIPEVLSIGSSAALSESFCEYTVCAGGFTYVFDRIKGVLAAIKSGNVNLLKKPAELVVMRCATYNTGGYYNTWSRARYDHIKQKTYGVEAGETDGVVTIKTKIALASAAMPPAVKADVVYTFTDKGVDIKISADVDKTAPALPRFGLRLVLPDSFGKSTYLGYGPIESYAERYAAARLSEYVTSPADDYDHYVRPQESSAHFGTRCASVESEKERLVFTAADTMCYKAIPYTDEELIAAHHDDELPESDKTVVTLDYKIHTSTEGSGRGLFNDKKFDFEIMITPEKK